MLPDLMVKLKYKADTGGACRGVAVMAMQAVQAKDLKSFDDRYKHLFFIYLKLKCSAENLAAKIVEIENKRVNSIRKYRNILLDALIKESSNNPAFDKDMLEKARANDNKDEKAQANADETFYALINIHKDNVHVKRFLMLRENINSILSGEEKQTALEENEKLKDEEKFDDINKHLLDARAFLEGVAIYYSPKSYPGLYETKSGRPTSQLDSELVFVRGMPQKLLNVKTEPPSGKVTAIHERALVKEVKMPISGIYDLDHLTQYLEFLRTNAPDIDPPCSFIFSSPDHSLTLTPTKEGWIVIDPKSEIELCVETKGDEISARNILQSFSSISNGITTFMTEIFCNEEHFSKVEKYAEEVRAKNLEIVKSMDDYSTLTDSNNASWLHTATQCGDIDTVNHLLEKNVDPNKKTKKGLSPLFMAINYDRTTIMNSLLDHKADPDDKEALIVASSREDHEIFKTLIERNRAGIMKVFEGNEEFKRALTLDFKAALESDHLEDLKSFFRISKADPNIKIDGVSALSLALARGEDYLEIMFEHGANPNIKSDDGTTTLYQAVRYQPHIVKLLLEHKANPYLVNDEGYTPLDHAIKLDRTKNIKILFFNHVSDVCEKLPGNPQLAAILEEVKGYSDKASRYDFQIKKEIRKIADDVLIALRKFSSPQSLSLFEDGSNIAKQVNQLRETAQAILVAVKDPDEKLSNKNTPPR